MLGPLRKKQQPMTLCGVKEFLIVFGEDTISDSKILSDPRNECLTEEKLTER